ncbi:MAG TPA: MFS transporter [Steroidobacteraceae bacterium]|nr:MFS transporter [Steroidobacteraceae bacterium]
MPPRNPLERKIRWRLVAPITLFLLLSSLDRVNISFAALGGMNAALGLSPAAYGFGAGILFVGFLAGQYPSVLALQRVGMRRWIGSCAILWALASGGISLSHSAESFYLLRIVVGFAEAGLAPGVVIYLSQFTTEAERARTFGVPMIAIPLSVAIGSPLSGWLMSTALAADIAPWRWLLICESLPCLVLGIAAYFYFPDHPQDAAWLTSAEIDSLRTRATADLRARLPNDWRVLRQPLVWIAALLWFCLLSGSYGIIFWLPQMVKSLTGLGPQAIGWINALPWLGAAGGMYLNAVHSDRTHERFWHVALPAVVAAAATFAAWQFGPGGAGLCALLVMGIGLGAAQGAFWSVPTMLLTRSTLAVAAVMINLLGSAGGLVMPHLIGYAVGRGAGTAGASLLIAATLAIAGALTLVVRYGTAPAATTA